MNFRKSVIFFLQRICDVLLEWQCDRHEHLLSPLQTARNPLEWPLEIHDNSWKFMIIQILQVKWISNSPHFLKTDDSQKKISLK